MIKKTRSKQTRRTLVKLNLTKERDVKRTLQNLAGNYYEPASLVTVIRRKLDCSQRTAYRIIADLKKSKFIFEPKIYKIKKGR